MIFDTHSIFSIPISIKHSVLNINNELINLSKSFESDTLNNEYNKFSKNYYVLNDVRLNYVKNVIETSLKEYEKGVMSLKDCQLKITNSWFSITESGGSHPTHNHPNSIISGCLYLKLPINHNTINFHHTPQIYKGNITIEPLNYNQFNSDSYTMSVLEGDIIFFPSWLNQSVNYFDSDEERIVLGFNTFIDGNLGNDTWPTKLSLKVKT